MINRITKRYLDFKSEMQKEQIFSNKEGFRRDNIGDSSIASEVIWCRLGDAGSCLRTGICWRGRRRRRG